MTVTNMLLYILLGLLAGILSGLVGVGGGVFLSPALVIWFGMSQHQAQGTTLALLVPPIGILAAWTYYQQGYVDVKVAAFICIGFVIGGFLGANLAVGIPNAILEKIFGGVIMAIALKMIFIN
jgi:uncharacterized protein